MLLPEVAEQGFEPRESDSMVLEPNRSTPYEDCLLESFYLQKKKERKKEKIVNADEKCEL